MSIIIRNKKALHDYFIIEQIEAGLVLAGSEVKSLRNGRANLKDSFVRIINNEAFVFGVHLTYHHTTNPYFKPDEKRVRKLLLHRKQIDKLFGQVSQKGLSIIPLQIYFNKKGYAKIIIALAKGKKEYDKRETIKRKELAREAQASMKNYEYPKRSNK
ncbi:SsrA-binding protein [Helicobacter didelphidarum]|uniref:SsrA-binding protein n=1 Tax=Helicobacter didelphidarum TaxID=2040648 RepID=A0A3D8IK99_9HELI|nr:SsrA-binding protein SmpB [Helicobacter didelphidarum]RDU64991.1 SsrA-binding protein [Helicobacter didelphidarum]